MNKKILIGAGILTLLIVLGGIFFILQSDEEGESGFANLFPFGQSEDSPILPLNPNTAGQTNTGGPLTEVTEENGLRKLSNNPVSGADFFVSATGTTVRFIERATGHIFEADLDSNTITRITNTTIPKIESVAWGIPAETFVAQYAESDAIQSIIVEITRPTGTTTEEFAGVDEFRIPNNALFPSFSPGGEEIFYLSKVFGGGVEGIITGPRGENPEVAWNFPTSEWISAWPQENLITLTSKGGNGMPGAMYTLNPETEATRLALSGILGLTTNTAPSGEKTLYSTSDGPSLGMHVWNRTDGSSSRISVETLAEKCVWSEGENTIYCAEPRSKSPNTPDDWYQGLVSYDDVLIQLNLDTGEVTQISDLTTATGERMDATNLTISNNEDYVLFINKKDLRLWAVPLN
jgi:hypothetical protein